MKMKKLIAIGILSSASTAFASLTVSFSFTPTLNSGTDVHDLASATWTFTFSSLDNTYVDVAGRAGAVTDSATLDITGSLDVDGTYAIVDSDATNFSLIPITSGNVQVGWDQNFNLASFTFSSVTVNLFGARGPSSISTPSIGDPVNPADFNGLLISETGFSAGGGNFSFENAALSAVPEPSHTALLTGAAMLLFGVLIRRQRR